MTTVYDTEQDIRGLMADMQERKDAGDPDWEYVSAEVHWSLAVAMVKELDTLRSQVKSACTIGDVRDELLRLGRLLSEGRE